MISKYRNKEIMWVAVFVILAVLLRVYKIDQLAIFLSDQAIDSFAVKNILSGNFTLLGPRASVGQFFNGPIVYYLMTPFYLIFRNDPLAGTIFQITLQIACMPFLYGVTKRFGGVRAGLVGLLIFTFSPLLLYYSRATFNAYPAIFFTTLIAYLITTHKPTHITALFVGLFTGMLVQMHYFLYMYAFMYLLYIAFRDWRMHISGAWNSRIHLIDSVYYLLGAGVGLAPFLVFELRHNFFNLRSILSSSSLMAQSVDIWSRLGSVGVAITNLFGSSSNIVGLFILICISGIYLYKKFDMRLKMLYACSLIVLLISTIVYRGLMHSHYIIGFYAVFIVVFSRFVSRVVPSRWLAAMSLGYIVWFFTVSGTSGLFTLSKDQDGFGLVDERKAVSQIIKWKKQSRLSLSYNVTQDTQQDNRAMPLRYLLSLDKTVLQPLPVEEYSSNSELFLIAKQGVDISKIRTWEVESFGDSYAIVDQSPINNLYKLFYLRKNH